MMVAFLIGAAIGFLAGFEEAKTERRYEDADEEPEIYRPIPMEHTHGGGLFCRLVYRINIRREVC